MVVVSDDQVVILGREFGKATRATTSNPIECDGSRGSGATAPAHCCGHPAELSPVVLAFADAGYQGRRHTQCTIWTRSVAVSNAAATWNGAAGLPVMSRAKPASGGAAAIAA